MTEIGSAAQHSSFGDDASSPIDHATSPAGVQPVPDGSVPVGSDSGSAAEPGVESEDSPRTSVQLDEEGDAAADYIEELLDIADLDGDIDIEARDGRVYLSVDSAAEGDLRLLSKPDTVNALQELTRIAVQTKTGVYSRLILDIGGSRAARKAELAVLVDRAIARLEDGAEAASLPPMSSYERKLVHDIVASRGFASESEDEGRNRHPVITRA